MGAESFARRPPRVTFTNVETGKDCTAQFNPEEVKEKVKANYKGLDVLGMSHKPLQYINTENYVATFTLGFDALSVYEGTSGNNAYSARLFLMSLCYPRRAAQGVPDGAPPRVLFSWPNLLSLTCVVTDLDFTHKRFNSALQSVWWTVDVRIEETRLVRLHSEDVLAYGTLRS